MKIAIYGDSFGIINTEFESIEPPAPTTIPGRAWVELLKDTGHEVTNFAKPGSAFMYSYKHFLANYSHYDLNIFVVTSPGRMYIEKLDGMLIFGSLSCDVEINRILKTRDYERKEQHLEILKSIKTYMEVWADWPMINHIQYTLVNNLWNLAPNTIVIPAFSDAIAQTKENLNDIASYEVELVNYEEAKKNPLTTVLPGKRIVTCNRKCHLSEENNRRLFELVEHAIKNKETIVEFKKSDVVKPSVDDYYHYLKIVDASSWL